MISALQPVNGWGWDCQGPSANLWLGSPTPLKDHENGSWRCDLATNAGLFSWDIGIPDHNHVEQLLAPWHSGWRRFNYLQKIRVFPKVERKRPSFQISTASGNFGPSFLTGGIAFVHCLSVTLNVNFYWENGLRLSASFRGFCFTITGWSRGIFIMKLLLCCHQTQ